MEANAILTPMRAIRMELEAANKSDMRVHGMCNLDLSVHGLIINMDTLVVDLNCHAILGMDVLGDASKLPFILDLVGGTLSGGGYETIQLHRFQAATECFAETTDSVCIPPHSEVMLWTKLKTNNGRRGPTVGVVLGLQTFVQEFGLLVGRSLVRADAEDWKIPILIYNSDPCTMQPDACTCNPIILPAHTRIARVEEIQAIQNIGSRETEMQSEECALPPHLMDVLDAATELTTNQRARAAHLLAKHVKTFPAPGTPITGRTEAVMHDIDTGSTRPIRCNPRKLSPKKIKIQQELVDKMLEEGQIEHSVSAWSAPTVLVTKKDGTSRFCVDYRRLNDKTRKDAFPLPRIDDSLNSLSGQSWFSTLDLASGYWQVRLSEDAKPKTAFATHSGLFQFAVMPFGLCNAPATFERLMSQVMRGLHWKRCLVYIDDILVFGHDFESALQSLELVLIRVAEYGLQLKSTKCNLFRSSVPFLGHIVGRAGLECDPSKVSAVANWIPPSTIKGVREFLGFTGYYRRFVPDYSTVAQPLVRLLGKDCKFKWTETCQDAFMALRALLIKAPVLAFPKEDLPYIVDTDASDYGIGGVLSQCIEGTEHVIAYYSKSRTPPRADIRTPEKAIDIQVVPDTPPAVIRTGRGRGRGKYRAQQQTAPRVGMRSSSRIMELEQREAEEAQAASARWPAQPSVTTQIETMTRQMHISEVPMNTQEELERVFPSGEEDAGMSSRQPPAAGLISRQQDTYFIPPPSRAVGGARGRSVSVSTATLGLIHRQDPNLATQLRENPASMMQERTRRRVYSTIRLIRTGLIGQMASLQQWEKAMNDQDGL